jgi:colicin import membrane protein
LGALLISFNWKTTHPISIAQVELWDSVAVEEHKPPPVPEPLPEPMPVEKEVPEPVVAPEEKPEPKVEIAIEKKPVKKEPVKEVPPKPVAKTNDALAKLQEEARQEALKNKSVTKSNTNDALKKLQQESLSEDKATGEQKASAASAGVVDEFKAKIQAKIRSNVNKTLCGNGNPELKFEIGLIPTGELSGSPKLIKSSGNAACDDAVERAIRVSEPLPLPQDASLFSQFRNLKLTFRPNDN